MVVCVTPSGGVLAVVLIVGIPAELGELLIPRYRVDNDSNDRLGSPVRLKGVGLTVFVTLGIEGGGPEL